MAKVSNEEFEAFINKVISSFGPQYAVPLDQIPDVVITLLAKTRPDSPLFDAAAAEFCTEQARKIPKFQGIRPPITIRPKELADYVSDICKGILYASKKHHAEQPQSLRTLRNYYFTPSIELSKGKSFRNFAAAIHGDTLLINPNIIIEHSIQAKTRNRARYREDDKVPGIGFDTREYAILTGMEEMVHHYQFERPDGHSGPKETTYTLDEFSHHHYANDPMEMEVSEFLKEAVKELGLGGKLEQPPAVIRGKG